MTEVHLTRWLWQCVVKVFPFMVRVLPQGYDPDTMTYRSPAVDGDGNVVVSGGAMEVVSTGTVDCTPQGSVTIPADAYGGVSLSNDGSSIVWLGVGAQEGSGDGIRLTVGGYRHLPVRNTTLHFHAISNPGTVYYVIYGTSS